MPSIATFCTYPGLAHAPMNGDRSATAAELLHGDGTSHGVAPVASVDATAPIMSRRDIRWGTACPAAPGAQRRGAAATPEWRHPAAQVDQRAAAGVAGVLSSARATLVVWLATT